MATFIMRGWTDDEDERLEQMWLSGMSSNEIGRAMRRSRNSIIGRLSRRGIKRPLLTPDQIKARFAQHLSNEATIAWAAHRVGVSKARGFELFREIKSELGWQAR